MTYCLGIVTKHGLVMASDSRTNAGYDQVNVCRKMHTFVEPGERLFVLLTSGSLSCAQSIMTLCRSDFDQGLGLASAESLYSAALATFRSLEDGWGISSSLEDLAVVVFDPVVVVDVLPDHFDQLVAFVGSVQAGGD